MGDGPKLTENRKSFRFLHVGRKKGHKSPKLSQLTSAYRGKSKSFPQVTSLCRLKNQQANSDRDITRDMYHASTGKCGLNLVDKSFALLSG